MNQQQCSDSLRPILALFSLTAAGIADYVAAILETCGWMDGYRFDLVCKEILRDVGIQRPRPAQFLAEYWRLEQSGAWPIIEHKCQDCGGTGYHQIAVIPPAYLYGHSRPMDAVEPCKCNPVKVTAKPGSIGNPTVTKIETPSGATSVERFIIAQQMRDPDYEAKVRAGWKACGFEWDGPLAEGASELIRRGPDAMLKALRVKTLTEKRETETEFVARRDAEAARLRASAVAQESSPHEPEPW